MFKIGDFSKMSKVTIKALRYYEKEGLIKPSYIDSSNGYRYYDSKQLLDISRIVSLKQIGLSIEEIKRIMYQNESLRDILQVKKIELENTIIKHEYELSKINYILEGKEMKEEIFEKTVPECYVYYKEGIIKNYAESSEFIRSSAVECLELNPNIKCIEPDYCFVNYLDGEYKEQDIKIRYCQAVKKEKELFKENESIKFMSMPETKCVCIYHKGSYDELGISYGKIMKYIESNNLEITDYPRECYIDGIWNKDNVEDWLTEIEVPIK